MDNQNILCNFDSLLQQFSKNVQIYCLGTIQKNWTIGKFAGPSSAIKTLPLKATKKLAILYMWLIFQLPGNSAIKQYTGWVDMLQEAKYVECWPNTTSAWAGWSRFDIPVDRYDGVHSQLICSSSPLGFPTCHQACQQENTYWTKCQKADRASTLVTLWTCS